MTKSDQSDFVLSEFDLETEMLSRPLDQLLLLGEAKLFVVELAFEVESVELRDLGQLELVLLGEQLEQEVGELVLSRLDLIGCDRWPSRRRRRLPACRTRGSQRDIDRVEVDLQAENLSGPLDQSRELGESELLILERPMEARSVYLWDMGQQNLLPAHQLAVQELGKGELLGFDLIG